MGYIIFRDTYYNICKLIKISAIESFDYEIEWKGDKNGEIHMTFNMSSGKQQYITTNFNKVFDDGLGGCEADCSKVDEMIEIITNGVTGTVII